MWLKVGSAAILRYLFPFKHRMEGVIDTPLHRQKQGHNCIVQKRELPTWGISVRPGSNRGFDVLKEGLMNDRN